MKTKKGLLPILVVLILALAAVSVTAGVTNLNSSDKHCSDPADCLVCTVADMINALPAAEDITVKNAATVTDQIHAIDRVKFNLDDEQYEELLTLVDTGTNESGQGLNVPVRYVEAVEAIENLDGGGWFAASKQFDVSGTDVDVTNAEVKIKITNKETNDSQTVTMVTIPANASSLSSDFYSMNSAEDGWSYQYMLPAGTYEVEEISDSGATVDGKEFVTSSVKYNNEVADSTEITIEEDEADPVTVYIVNVQAPTITVNNEGNGSVSLSENVVGNQVAVDESVTITATPDEGWSLDSITVTAEDDSINVVVTENGDGTYTFVMPASNVTVLATFKENSTVGGDPEPAPAHADHPLCGAACKDHDGKYGDTTAETHAGIEYVPLNADNLGDEEYTLSDGNYYLEGDIDTDDTITVTGTVNLCLNGYKLQYAGDENRSVITAEDGAVLNITDCGNDKNTYYFKVDTAMDPEFRFDDELRDRYIAADEDTAEVTISGGVIAGGTGTFEGSRGTDRFFRGGGIFIQAGASVNIYDGTVGANMAGHYLYNGSGNIWGGGIYNAGTLNVYGGNISSNSAKNTRYNERTYGGGVYMASNAEFNMYGGEISDNYSSSKTGVCVGDGDQGNVTFNMYGGTISRNDGFSGAPAVYVNNSSFHMFDGTITENTSGNGAAVMVTTSSMFIMDDGEIIDNDSRNSNGGGVSVLSSSFTMNGGLISENNAGYGGGVYIGSNGIFTMKNGEISKNYISKTDSGSGVHLNSATATFNLEGGSIIGNYCYDEFQIYNLTSTGGIYASSGTINIGATDKDSVVPINVKDNKNCISENEQNPSNMFVQDSTSVMIPEGKVIPANSVIGVTTDPAAEIGSPVKFATGGIDHISSFVSDVERTVIEATAEKTGLQVRALDTDDRTITVDNDIANGSISVDNTIAHGGDTITVTTTANEHYVIDKVTVTKSDNSTVAVTANENDATKFTFTMPADNVTVSATFKDKLYKVNIDTNFVGGTVVAAPSEAKLGDTVTLTATPVSGYEFESLKVTGPNGETITTTSVSAGGDAGSEDEVTPANVAPLADLLAVDLFSVSATATEGTSVTFTMPAGDVKVEAVFTKKVISGLFTVEAVVTSDVEANTNVDKDTTRDGMHVYADDVVRVDVVVKGADYTNADWTLVYDYSKFKYDRYVVNSAYDQTGIISHGGSNVEKGVIIGNARGTAGKTNGDEFKADSVLISYYFTAIPQLQEVTANFEITEAHVNNYEMAGIQDNTAATLGKVPVTIILAKDAGTDEDGNQIPAGTIEDVTTVYNAKLQTGAAFVLADSFKEATVTYAANADGSAVVDDEGDGDLTDEIAALSYKTALPSWQNVGEYTYYVRVSGDGLATIYDSAVLTITPATLTPGATFAVDPDVDKVVITPTLEGVLDGSHNGKVTVTYTDATGEKTETLDASAFVYDGEITSVYSGNAIEVKAPKSGDFTVTLDYIEGVATETTHADNYTGNENTAVVNVDKISAPEEIVKALEESIESVFSYDSKEHKVIVNDLSGITEGDWTASTPVDVYEGTEDPTVTNVGDEKLVKVVFTDKSEVYNEVTVYVVLKVTPANVLITIDDKEKFVGQVDPTLTGTVQIVDEKGEPITAEFNENGFYGNDDLSVKYVRELGETVGTYDITANYVPNNNYKVIEPIEPGVFTIKAPNLEAEDSPVKVEIVDLSQGNPDSDQTPDYITGKRLVLVYTDQDKLFYGYGSAENYELLFDVTAAGYKYIDNDYDTNTFVEEDKAYKHVYGIVVDAIGTFEATEDYEKQYRDNLVFLGTDLSFAPQNIVYDADINMSDELDVNDYSMNNGIYNDMYDRFTYLISLLKADFDHNKTVDTKDSIDVKAIVDPAIASGNTTP